jgi:pSer/pThr/pTyr-binding forkhead associated (FHA) protein
VVETGPDAGARLELREFERRYVAGRGSRADLVLDDPDASRRHVEFVRQGEQLLVRDLGSKNGASVLGRKLPTDKGTAWKPGEELRMGANVLSYEDPLAGALEELEGAVDEPMEEGESVPPPTTEATSASDTGAAPFGEPPSPGTPTPNAEAQLRQQPTRRPAPRIGTDLLVALLAIAVLALSALGLFWVFGSD